ncbi:hypothetical protein [Leisingera methylohalidivorans]|uniref:Protein ImuA n=1 Tax=Leisingera methylohalidivorans DSM 14336 TaxID=999552 RepID=V9VQR8_9RHOB|nr:hypothetical protein [Leisingera methylohalidivorans]AHD00044.1 hypothetical protein METH_04360 [Leisingera methylohalidivorans DSM 14336]
MPTHLLSRRRHRSRPALSVMEGVALEHGRVHEACGPARHSFALWLAAAALEIAPGPVLWLSPAQGGKQLNPDGMAEFASPARFLFVQPPRTEDQLWAMEEALRSGAAALVVAELAEPPAMTPVRRLHLAAAAGGRFGPAPLGLLLTPGTGGAQGIESRWHLAPAHTPLPDPLPHARPAHRPPAGPASDSTAKTRNCWTLKRLRARTLPPCSWQITRAAGGCPHQSAPLRPAPPCPEPRGIAPPPFREQPEPALPS